MSVRPSVEALGVNTLVCQAAKGVRKGRVIECGEPASFRLTFAGLPPLCMCLECYEYAQRRDKDTPTVAELRGK